MIDRTRSSTASLNAASLNSYLMKSKQRYCTGKNGSDEKIEDERGRGWEDQE